MLSLLADVLWIISASQSTSAVCLLVMRGMIDGFHMTCYAACKDANLQEFMPEGKQAEWGFLTVKRVRFKI